MDKARAVVDKLIGDLTDRGGLSQEWEQIDEDIQQEIREEWAKIIFEGMSHGE